MNPGTFASWTRAIYPRRRTYYHWGCGPVLAFQLAWELVRFMIWITGVAVLCAVAIVVLLGAGAATLARLITDR